MIQQLLQLAGGWIAGKTTNDPGAEESIRALAEVLVHLREWQRDPSDARRANVTQALEALPLGTLEATLRQWGSAGEQQWQEVLALRQTWFEAPAEGPSKESSKALLDGLSELIDLGDTESTTGSKKLWLKWAMYLIPLVAAYFLGDFLREENSLDLESEQVIWPRDAYQNVQHDTALVLSKDYQQKFQDRFPDWYFRTDPSLKNWFMLEDDNGFSGPAVEIKWIFKNRSESFIQLLSTLQISAELIEERPYPWKDLRVESGFAIEQEEMGELQLVNTGNTPILDLMVTVKGPEGFHRDTLIRALEDNSYWNLMDAPPEGWKAARVNSTTGQLQQPLFVLLDDNTVQVAEEDLRVGDHYYHEEFSLETLKNKTKVIDATWEVRSYWKDLHGRSDSNRITLIQPDLIYYQTSDSILTSLPLMEVPLRPEANPVAQIGYDAAQHAYDMLTRKEPETHPAGVNSWTGRLQLDWDDAPNNLPATVMIHPDIPLNPSGFAVVYFRFLNPKNGRYRLQLKSNNKVIRTIEFETLVPDEYRFNFPQSLKYFEED